ncbi:MAG: glycosyltransferase N-terminal domain-containing protein [Daejeonella sp.]|uniref:3-deoxy-D-manno-octulosonic acid transferase n=1 Tax=Daejeonella sp. TaxID=2805397 RepID=UPI003C796DB5
MLFLYNLGIQFYRFLIFLASLRNKKATAWIEGRKNLLQKIASQINPSNQRVWFHFASLGEFEQGRPVLEELKSRYPGISIVVTFFSPSGYEIRKDYKGADHVFYLPLDTRENAVEFIKLVRPTLAIFTKYEYWYHYFEQLHENNIPLFIVSGIFRKDQPFFKWYGFLHRKMLKMVSHFFVQNEVSKTLLATVGQTNVSVTGDTRFDRVVKNMAQVPRIKAVEEFVADKEVFIAGSTWPEDEVLIVSLTNDYPHWKFIIAPHEVDSKHIREIEKLFPNSVKFSEINKSNNDQQVLIIDNIGTLSSLYQYGDIAYIGGGFRVGIHNTQEASAFSLPVIFGPNYEKFQEALDLVQEGASFSIKDSESLKQRMAYLQDQEVKIKLGKIAKEYIIDKAGATRVILDYIEKTGLINS